MRDAIKDVALNLTGAARAWVAAALRGRDAQAATKEFSIADQKVEVRLRRRLDDKIGASLNIGAQSERCPARTMQGVFLPKLRETAEKLRQQLV